MGRSESSGRPTAVPARREAARRHNAVPDSRWTFAAIWLLTLAPLALLPGLYDRWGWPTLVCALAGAVIAFRMPRAGAIPRGYAWTITALCVVLFVVTLFGDEPLVQLLGRAPRYEGFVTLGVLVAVGFAGARLLGPAASVARRSHFVMALAVASVLLAGLAVLETLGMRPIESDMVRPGSFTGNATDQGLLGAVFTALLGAYALGEWRRDATWAWWAVVGAIAGVVSVATSNSRAGLLALALVFIALVIGFLLSSPHRRRDGLIAGGGVFTAFVAVLAVPLTRERLFGDSAFAQQTVADRFYMWDDAWQLFLSAPWTGVGLNGFADRITPFFGDEWFGRALVGATLDSPHNVVVQAAVVGGVPGLLAALAVGGGALWLGVRHARGARGAHRDIVIGALIAVVAAGVGLLTHVTSPVTLVPLAMLVGIMVAVPANTAERPAAQNVITAIGGVGLVFLLVCTAADAALFAGQRAAMRGDLPASYEAFETAQALRPWDPDVALTAAATLGAAVQNGLAGAIDPAEEWAGRALVALPNSARANYVAGMVAVERRDTLVAAKRLSRASVLSPADPRIQHEAGVALLVAGDLPGAKNHLERATALAPSSSVSWQVLRDVCSRQGDTVCVREADDGERAASADG